MERDAVWIKCRTNSGSRCQPEEVSYEDKCYKLFIPTIDKQNKSVQDIGFSKVEALEHCQKRGGSLIDISSQVFIINFIKLKKKQEFYLYSIFHYFIYVIIMLNDESYSTKSSKLCEILKFLKNIFAFLIN